MTLGGYDRGNRLQRKPWVCYKEAMELAGKVAVVTGAARGIGREIALCLAEAGADLMLADMNEAELPAVVEEVRKLGRRAHALRVDVRNKQELNALLAATLRELGACHVLVNNAGVFHAGRAIDCPDEQWTRVLETNLWGVIHGSRIFGQHFVQRGAGHIVNMASGAGLMGAPGMTSYSTAKFGVVGFSEVLRWELAAQGVGVTHVCPGIVRTGIAKAEGAGLTHVDVDGLLRFAPPARPLANKVVRAIRKNRPRVIYGFESRLFLMLRLLPYPVTDLFGRFVAKQAMQVIEPKQAEATTPQG